jgi:ribonuclease HII
LIAAVGCDARLESELVASGFRLIAGVDEVGRGALAGPVVAAAVIFNLSDLPDGIDDSKKLAPIKREKLAAEIKRRAVCFRVARVEHDEIDRINIHRASLLAMQMAVKALQPPPEYVLIDGRHTLPNLNCPQRAIIKGDTISVSIAAASIIAKVTRDRWMRDYDRKYPGYGFASHVGYGTFAHYKALARLGPSPIHRMTYQPLLDLLGAQVYELPGWLKHRPKAR